MEEEGSACMAFTVGCQELDWWMSHATCCEMSHSLLLIPNDAPVKTERHASDNAGMRTEIKTVILEEEALL